MVRNFLLTAALAAILVAVTALQAQAYADEARHVSENFELRSLVSAPVASVRSQVQTYDHVWEAAPAVFAAPLGGHVE